MDETFELMLSRCGRLKSGLRNERHRVMNVLEAKHNSSNGSSIFVFAIYWRSF